MRWLHEAVTEDSPQQHKLAFCLWTLGIIRSLLKRRFGVELRNSGISRLWTHLGLSPQRPIYRSYQQDPKSIEKYLKRTFPQVHALARKRGAVIYLVDEAAICADSLRGTTWGKVGQTPVAQDSGGRFRINLISAVSPRGDRKLRSFEGRMNENKDLEFRTDLLHDTGRPLIVIADNASYHSGKFAKKCARRSNGKITLFHSPANAPELTPDEQVWNHSKARFGKVFVETKEHLLREVRNIPMSVQRSRDFVRSVVQMKDTRYAADAC
jgi:hypothetical protein